MGRGGRGVPPPFCKRFPGAPTPLPSVQVEAARLLLQEGADCEAVALRSNGKTALDFAIISGHSPSVEMVEVLVDYGCPLRCALGTAASVGRLDVMDLLLFKGAWACYDVQQHGSLVIRAAQSGQGSVVTRAVEVCPCPWQRPEPGRCVLQPQPCWRSAGPLLLGGVPGTRLGRLGFQLRGRGRGGRAQNGGAQETGSMDRTVNQLL